MTELALTPPSLRRLFQTVDLAPHPQHDAVASSLGAWRRARKGHLLPTQAQVGMEQPGTALANSLIAEWREAGSDFLPRSSGEGFRKATGLREDARTLSDSKKPRVAARLRRLFGLTLERREPVLVRFCEGQRDFEVLAAPLVLNSGHQGIWCTLATRAFRAEEGAK